MRTVHTGAHFKFGNKCAQGNPPMIHAIWLGFRHGCVPSKQQQGQQSAEGARQPVLRTRKEPDNQSSGKTSAEIDSKTAAAASTFLLLPHLHYIPDCDKSAVQVQPSVESSSSHYEIMTASRVKGSLMYGLGSVCTFPNRQSLRMAPAQSCKHCFGKELTEPSNLSDYYVNACGCYTMFPLILASWKLLRRCML